MASYRNTNLCFYCKRFNYRHKDCRTRIQDKQPCMDARGRKYWPRRYTHEEMTQEPISPISALTNYVTPLMGSRSVLTQIILNLCLASLTPATKSTTFLHQEKKSDPESTSELETRLCHGYLTQEQLTLA